MTYYPINKRVQESLAIREYIEGNLSLGEVADIFGKRYIDMREWLQKRGVDPTGAVDDGIEAIQKKNIEKALNDL